MPGQYKYRWDLIAQTTQFEQNMIRAAEKARKVADNVEKAKTEIGGMEKAAGSGGSAIEGMGNKAEHSGEKIASVMGTLGSAIGGVKGEVVSLLGEFAALGGPVALITAGVGGIALAWSQANDQIEKYLESVDKGKYNPAIFNRDSKKAYQETKDIAAGGMYAGANLKFEANRKLNLVSGLTEEEKIRLHQQIELGEQMVKENKALQESLGIGTKIIKDRVVELAWIQKRNELLKQADELDKEKIKNQTEINGLEGDLVELKTKIFTAGEGDKDKLLLDYEKKATEIKDKKIRLLTKEQNIQSELLKMTGKSEELELLGLKTAESKSAVEQANRMDLFQMRKLINKVNKSGDGVSVRDLNNESSEGYKLGTDLSNVNGTERAGYANVQQLLTSKALLSHGLATPEGINNLVKFNGLTQEEIAGIIKTNTELERQQQLADGLTGIFVDMFSSINGGFEEMVKSLMQNLEKLALQLAAEEVVFALLSLIPGFAPVAGGLMKSLDLIPKFAAGGIVSGPTIAQVGEYGGARSNPEVIAPLSKLQGMLTPSALSGKVIFKIGNRELTGTLERDIRIRRNITG